MARLAFVMGSNGPEEFGRLNYAEKDADEIAASLIGLRCGFEVTRVSEPFYGDAFDLRRQLHQVTKNCKPSDTFVCYFSGHGVLEGGELYLVCDQSTQELDSTALPVEEVMRAMRKCEANNKLLILDCCHAGGAVDYKGTSMGLPVDEIVSPSNHLVLMASGRLEKAREFHSIEGSFLTRKICDALNEGFYEADVDGDQRLSIKDLMTWLERSAASHNSSSSEKVPTPHLFGKQQGEFFLTSDSADWKPYEIPWPDGSTLVILPIAPIPSTGFRWRRNPFPFEMALGIGKYPITNSQYRTFLAETKLGAEPIGEHFDASSHTWRGPYYPWRDPNFSADTKPVVCVSYEEAYKYCQWSHKIALRAYPNCVVDVPPHRLWDFAAFGVEYPTRNKRSWLHQSREIHHNSSSPAVIDETDARLNQRGVSDMIGNVWEWCGKYGWAFAADGGFRGPSLRGGGFLDDLGSVQPFLSGRYGEKIWNRSGDTRHSDLGFRLSVLLPITVLSKELQTQLRLCKQVDWEEEFRAPALGENTDWA